LNVLGQCFAIGVQWKGWKRDWVVLNGTGGTGGTGVVVLASFNAAMDAVAVAVGLGWDHCGRGDGGSGGGGGGGGSGSMVVGRRRGSSVGG